MSASREKKARQERGADYLSPRQQKALEEQKAARRTTAIFIVCAALFVVAVAAMVLNNSGVFQRGAAAASVNGKSYTASDMAYYYYNTRANYSSSIDTSSSLREQEYTASDSYDTWYDYVADRSLQSLAAAEVTAQAAKDAGYTGDAEMEQTISDTMDSLASAASANGYSVGGYIKAIFGGLMTRSSFEQKLRTAALADAFVRAKADVASYSDAELTAVYDADPNTYSRVSYQAVVFPSSSFATEAEEATETSEAVEADDGSAAALAAAQDALARYRKGEKLDALADELDGTYMDTSTLYGTGSDMLDWLFDDARRDGDADVLDYTYYGNSMGSVVVVFGGRERADFHTVDVRHILVEDEATANDVLARYLAGAQTEDAFAALAQEYSTDNADDGGLYENVYPGQMVKPFEDWCFDAARQSGDTGIVQTDYGYHVMYFVGTNDYAYWQVLAANKLASDWQTGLTENLSTELLSGMKYIDP